MRFFQWLGNKKAKKMPKNAINENNKPDINSGLVEKMQEIENALLEKEEKKFIDEETGKEYKTERGLKGAITRRLNKAKKQKERKNDK